VTDPTNDQTTPPRQGSNEATMPAVDKGRSRAADTPAGAAGNLASHDQRVRQANQRQAAAAVDAQRAAQRARATYRYEVAEVYTGNIHGDWHARGWGVIFRNDYGGAWVRADGRLSAGRDSARVWPSRDEAAAVAEQRNAHRAARGVS